MGLNPHPPDVCRSTRRFWENKDYRQWESPEALGRTDPMQWSKRRFLGHLLPRLEGKVVLELGCGPGVLTPYLAECAKRVVGIDFSERAVSTAQKRCRGFRNARFEACDVMEFAPGSKFDVITGSMFLHEIMIDRTPAFLEQMDSLLGEEGFLCFHENSYFNVVSRFIREHLVGRYGIPKHGSENELPFDEARFRLYCDHFEHCVRFVDGVELATKIREYFIPINLGAASAVARGLDRALTHAHARTGLFTNWSYTQTVYASHTRPRPRGFRTVD